MVLTHINIEKITQSKIKNVDFNNLVFGKVFTDHMFVCDYVDGEWQTPNILPYQPIMLDPSAKVFHYGQAVFEGMKAYKDENDEAWLFRPEDNLERINKSSARLAIPEFPKDYFLDGLKTLLELDKDWIQKGFGNSLYIRPFVFSTESGVSASPSNAYKFFIICSPVGSYYSGNVRVIFAEKFSRSAQGGIGFAKAAGNYAAQFYPTELAKQKGFDQIVWTDSNTHEYLEEAGTMNIFFRINDSLITAPTNDRILDGITRKSIIKLAENQGVKVEIRPVKVSEIVNAARNGSLKEMFGTGTAAVISVISAFSYRDEVFELPTVSNPYSGTLKKQLLDIQYNNTEDLYGWMMRA